MTGYYVTWHTTGVAYVEAQSKQDAILLFDREPSTFVYEDDALRNAFAEYATDAE